MNTDFGNLVLDYWSLAATSNGFSGTLVNNGESYGYDLNQVDALAYQVPLQPQFGSILEPYILQDAQDGAQYECHLSATFTSANTLDFQLQGGGGINGSQAIITINLVATRVS